MKLLLILVGAFAMTFLSGLLLTTWWNWFVPDALGLARLSYYKAISLMSVVSIFSTPLIAFIGARTDPNLVGDDLGQFWSSIATSLFTYAINFAFYGLWRTLG